MNSYEISFTSYDVDRTEYPRGKRMVVGTFEAKNGIEAIKVGLRSKNIEETMIEEGRTLGSNKRLVLHGITFEAKKVA